MNTVVHPSIDALCEAIENDVPPCGNLKMGVTEDIQYQGFTLVNGVHHRVSSSPRILSNVLLNRRAMQPSAGPLDGGFWWSHFRNAPGRVSFADELVSRRHTGWFLDACQNEKARGVVVRLPRGRFLAGFEDGRGSWRCAGQLFDTPEDAAHDADEQARIYAEAEFEYNEAWHEGDILRGVIEEKTRDVLGLFDARHHPRVRRDIVAHVADIRALQAEFNALCDRYDLSY